MNEEYIKLSRIVDEVRVKAGIALPVKLYPFDLYADPYIHPLMLDGGVHPSGLFGRIRYVPGITQRLPEDAIKGVIAHEISHIAHEDYSYLSPAELKQHELIADLFAVGLGYGSGLLKAFKDYYEPALGPLYTRESDTHPAMAKRIQILEEALNASA